jgi:hypothetical protein
MSAFGGKADRTVPSFAAIGFRPLANIPLGLYGRFGVQAC